MPRGIERRKAMELQGAAGPDPLATVRVFLGDLQEGRKTRAQVGEIREALETLHARIVRVRALAAQFPRLRGVDFSDEIWDLLELIGKRRAVKRFAARAALL